MRNKKAFIKVLAGLGMVASGALAGGLQEEKVAKDARWLAHIDVEAFMRSEISAMAVEGLKEEMRKENESGVSIDVEAVLAELKSITAYGLGFHEGADQEAVLVLETGEKLPIIIEGLLAHEALIKGEEVDFEQLDDKPFTTYLFDNELYVANPAEGLVIASKTFERIEQAFEVIRGKAPNLRDADKPLVLNKDAGFFLIASAIGFDKMENMPTQARILQKTTGGQLSVGINDAEARLNLILSTSSKEVTEQLHKIIQGMLALASFAEVENENVAQLLQRVQVEVDDLRVEIDFRYPVEDLMRLMQNMHGEGHIDDYHESHSNGHHNNHSWRMPEDPESRASLKPVAMMYWN